MELQDSSPRVKALEINLDENIYGTFAEIGAGQEVARHFFQAGKASQTIAKTISAYDMTFSDEIYGKAGRYVCEARLVKMLDHEFSLLQERLPARRDRTRFFAFADTVATSADGLRSHGWLGVRYQTHPGGAYNDIIVHVKLWDNARLQQQEALGALGVNLIHSAFFPPDDPKDRIAALLHSLSTKRVEVNMIRFTGPDLAYLDQRLMSLELVHQGLTEAILFGAKGEVLLPTEALWGKPLLCQRGTFRPVTNTNVTILNKGVEQFSRHPLASGTKPEVLFELTMKSLTSEGVFDDEDFLNRVDTLAALGHKVLISKFDLFYQVKSYLRQCTDQLIGIVIGASHLEKVFDASFYRGLPGGMLEGFSRLFDEKTRLFVYPFKSDQICLNSRTFNPGPLLAPLYQYLLVNDLISDLLDCDDLDTSMHSRDVREMLSQGKSGWQDLVPRAARDLIVSRKLFGYRPLKK